MPRPPKNEAHQELASEIKAIAFQQLADKGTNGISLRGIARELGITAPAIYNYYPRLDDLITALLVDAFTGHADAIDAAIANEAHAVDKLRAGMHAYRQWALQHAADFQLIYGNPIPGFEAPREITVPLASRPQESFARCMLEAHRIGQLSIPADYQVVPQSIMDYLSGWLYQRVPEIKEMPGHMQIFYLMEVGWSRIHGIVMLEIHHHIGPAIGDVDSLFNNEVELFLKHLGMK